VQYKETSKLALKSLDRNNFTYSSNYSHAKSHFRSSTKCTKKCVPNTLTLPPISGYHGLLSHYMHQW